MTEKEKKPLIKREYVPIVVAIVVLVILILALVFTILYNGKSDLQVPDAPSYKKLDISVIDFTKGGSNANDLNETNKQELNVDYKIISDYYEQDIMLSNTQVEYLNNVFVITSGPYSKDAFISTISKDGKLNWISKINNKNYKTIAIAKVIYTNDNYYVFATGKKDNKNDIIVLKIDKNGKQSKITVVAENVNNTLKNVIEVDNGFALVCDGSDNISMYFINYDFNTLFKPYFLKDDANNIFLTYAPSVQGIHYENGKLHTVVYYSGNNNSGYYILTLQLNNQKSTLEQFTRLNNYSSENILTNENEILAIKNKKIYVLAYDGEIINEYSYEKLKLENEEEYLKNAQLIDGADEEEGFTFKNDIFIENINSYDNVNLVTMKTAFNNIYDVLDNNYKLSYRYMIDYNTYIYDDGVFLKAFCIDNKIYEIYSYGTTTPSIMISVIG